MRKVLYMLGQLSDDNIEWMLKEGQRQQVPAGTVLIQQGVPSDRVLIVLDGALGIYVTENGRENRIAVRTTGEILGEVSFVDDSPPSATVKTEEASLLFTLDKNVLEAKLAADRDFAARFYRGIAVSLSYRLRESMGQAEDRDIQSVDDIEDDDALDSHVLESAYLAGLRFERILKRMMD